MPGLVVEIVRHHLIDRLLLILAQATENQSFQPFTNGLTSIDKIK